jgi:hypothetical protein
MFILYNKIKIEIDINNYELLETIWEHMREIKRGERGYYSIDKPPSPFLLFLPLSHILEVKLELKFKDLFNY